MSINGRSRPFLLLLASMFVIAGCAAHNDADTGLPPGVDRGSVCRTGNGDTNRQAPIVCVDDSARTLSVNPEPLVMHDVLESDRKTPVMVHWFTRSGGGDLRLEIEPGCVTKHRCDGNGHCWARSIPRSTKQCKYDVWITGGNHDRLDPTIAITSCCG